MAKKQNNDSFIFYTAYIEKFQKLTAEQFRELVTAMSHYIKIGEIPNFTARELELAFDVVKYDMDRNSQKYGETCEKRQEAAIKKWEKEKGMQKDANDANASKSIQMHQKDANDAYNDKEKENDNEKENDKDNDTHYVSELYNKSPAPEAHRYGVYNNVVLKDDERDALMNAYPDSYQEKIDNLSMYMKSKGAVYRDHYATIMKWAREDAGKDVQKASPSRYPPKQGSAEDLANFSNMLKEMAEERRKGDKK